MSINANEVNDEGDEKPIGIILCADTWENVAEYALGGLANQIFASKYVYYIPNKEELIQQVQQFSMIWTRPNKKYMAYSKDDGRAILC